MRAAGVAVLTIVIALSIGCRKQKSAAAKAECATLIDVIDTSAGAMRGAVGAPRDVHADRFERIRQQIADVTVTDPKLKTMQDNYVGIVQMAADRARDKSLTDAGYKAWLETLRVQEGGALRQMQSYCSKP